MSEILLKCLAFYLEMMVEEGTRGNRLFFKTEVKSFCQQHTHGRYKGERFKAKLNINNKTHIHERPQGRGG